jgi:PAS domain S-box-containing protein
MDMPPDPPPAADPALRQALLEYEALLSNASIGIAVTRNRTFLHCNARWGQMFGWKPAELAGQPTIVVYPSAEAYEELSRMAVPLLGSGERIDTELRMMRRDGVAFWCRMIARALDPADHAKGTLFICEDISERKAADEALKQLLLEYRAILDNASLGIIFTRDGAFVHCNERFGEMFGWRSHELIGLPTSIFYRSQDDYRALSRIADPILSAGKRLDVEWEMRRRDGGTFWCRMLAKAIDPADYRKGAVFITEDITERKATRDALLAAHEELLQAHDELEQRVRERTAELVAASRAKSDFLSKMSHELRSPLNVILGFSRLLAHEPGLSGEARNDIETIVRSGEHLHALINEVLDISMIEAGRVTLNERVFDLRALLDEVENMFRMTAQKKGLRLSVAAAPELPRMVRADPVKLRQVLINLMGNAVKFTADGSVSLRAGRLADAGGMGRLAFEVEDTGSGIEPAELRQLGELFVQAQAGRQSGEGTGLGLAICRNFVQLMGGELRIESRIGEGTAVRFEIALREGGAGDGGDGWPNRSVLGLAPGQPAYRILVAEDRPDARRMLVRQLRRLGFEVDEAGDGEQAVAAWRSRQPHLIFMDMRMPVMDGCEATRRIKAAPDAGRTRIVALTASSFEEERVRVMACGCDGHLSKPYREQDMYRMLQQMLGAQFVFAEAAGAAPAALPDRARLAALPAASLQALREALTEMDVDAIERAIEAVRGRDAGLAEALAAQAAEFQYDRILALMDQD